MICQAIDCSLASETPFSQPLHTLLLQGNVGRKKLAILSRSAAQLPSLLEVCPREVLSTPGPAEKESREPAYI